MNKLILGLAVFFGVHSISLLALGWRNRVAERLGTLVWQGIYSVIALLGFYLLVTGYGAARASAAVVYVTPSWLRYVAALLMLPVFPLALASVLPGRIRARAGTSLAAGDHAVGRRASPDQRQRRRPAALRQSSSCGRSPSACRSNVARRGRYAFFRCHRSTMRSWSSADSRSTRLSFSGCTPRGSGQRRSAFERPRVETHGEDTALGDRLVAVLLGRQDLELVDPARLEVLLRHQHAGFRLREVHIE